MAAIDAVASGRRRCRRGGRPREDRRACPGEGGDDDERGIDGVVAGDTGEGGRRDRCEEAADLVVYLRQARVEGRSVEHLYLPALAIAEHLAALAQDWTRTAAHRLGDNVRAGRNRIRSDGEAQADDKPTWIVNPHGRPSVPIGSQIARSTVLPPLVVPSLGQSPRPSSTITR